jgi:hypothetical protein
MPEMLVDKINKIYKWKELSTSAQIINILITPL